jgi:hypothetical protein
MKKLLSGKSGHLVFRKPLIRPDRKVLVEIWEDKTVCRNQEVNSF